MLIPNCDAGSLADARVSINVGERTDDDAESAASASVSIGNKHDLIDCDICSCCIKIYTNIGIRDGQGNPTLPYPAG